MKEVKLVPYNSKWAQEFQNVSNELKSLFEDNLIVIHHIGSTAVPGIHAKPIIDVLPVVRSHSDLDTNRWKLEEAGYCWYGEFGIPGRRYVTKPAGDQEEDLAHFHCFELEHPEIERHLAFRDALLNDALLAVGYEQLKLRLQEQFSDERERYQVGKRAFIEHVIQKYRLQ